MTSVVTEPEFVQVVAPVTIDNECCICLDDICDNNCCTNKCGHRFCFSCMSRYIATTVRNDFTKEVNCPLCRDVIVDAYNDDDDDDDDDDVTSSESSESIALSELEPDEDGNIINIANMFIEHSDDDDESDDDDDDIDVQYENEPGVTSIKIVSDKLIESGVTFTDLATIILTRYSKENPQYSKHNMGKMIDELFDIVDSLDIITSNEYSERMLFSAEDIRV